MVKGQEQPSPCFDIPNCQVHMDYRKIVCCKISLCGPILGYFYADDITVND